MDAAQTRASIAAFLTRKALDLSAEAREASGALDCGRARDLLHAQADLMHAMAMQVRQFCDEATS